MIAIREMSFCELHERPEWPSLQEEYSQESSVPDMGPTKVDLLMYKKMSDVGALKTFVAFDDDQAIGYINFVVSPNLHYSKPIGSTESFFVKASHRDTGAGMVLLRGAEKCAKSLGAVAFLVTAPICSKLRLILEKSKSYKETNIVFFRSLG
jgi:GNAT superfamily N-acetyltransferase